MYMYRISRNEVVDKNDWHAPREGTLIFCKNEHLTMLVFFEPTKIIITTKCTNSFRVQFRTEEHAANAVAELNQRWFGGRPIYAELSPVTDFREACCREFKKACNRSEIIFIMHPFSLGQYEMGECVRSGFCNFMHLKPISRELRRDLYGRNKPGGGRTRPRSRSRDRGDNRGGR